VSGGTAASFGSAELRVGDTRVVIIPALGGKIASLHMAGREWLWRSDVIPFQAPLDGASFVETADSGGYDECFPTVGACMVPTRIAHYGGVSLPDHGELWAQPTTFSLETRPDGMYAACGWLGRRMSYRFERAVFVDSADAVEMRYAVVNAGPARLPFIWSAHPLLHFTSDTRLILPDGARTRVWAQHGIDLGGCGAERRWPLVPGAGKQLDFSQPGAVARAYACKLFLDMPVGRAAIEQGGARLEVTFDTRQVPNFGLWLNKRGWTPFAKRQPYLNLGFEPCIGAPDTLSEALGTWQGAHWLAPGERREWTLTWRARRV
jgi:galactose mutarotase-like enzyme